MNYETKKDLLATNLGRHGGWNVYAEGAIVCSLHYFGGDDMFWDLYVIRDVDRTRDLHSDAFWGRLDLEYECRTCPQSARRNGIIASYQNDRDLVSIRSLYVKPEKLSLWEAYRFACEYRTVSG